MSSQPKLLRTTTAPATFDRLLQFVDVRAFMNDYQLKMELVNDFADVLNRQLPPPNQEEQKIIRASTLPMGMKLSSSSSSSSPSSKKKKECEICYNEVDEYTKVCNNDDCESPFCRSCLAQTFKMALDKSMGTCPLLRCPGCMHFLVFSNWRDIVEPDLAKQYEENASRILSLKCGSCHTQSSLMRKDVPQDVAADTEAFIKEVAALSGEEKAEEFRACLANYKRANIQADEFYSNIIGIVAPNNLASVLEQSVAAKKVELAAAREQLAAWKRENVEYKNAVTLLEKTTHELETQQRTLQSIQEGKEEPQPADDNDNDDDDDEDDDNEKKRPPLMRQTTMQMMTNRLATCDPAERLAILGQQIDMLSQSVDALKSVVSSLEATAMVNTRVAELSSSVKHMQARAKSAAIDVQQAQSEQLKMILYLIEDVERRSSLHLRMMVINPTIKSLCCNYTHCFRCQIRDGHPAGTTCEMFMAAQVGGSMNDIRFCPSCRVALVKGDGCNSLTCVCGKTFDWSSAERA